MDKQGFDSNWMTEEFGNDPLIMKGWFSSELWNKADLLAIAHITGVLSDYYERLFSKRFVVDIFIANDSFPSLKVLLSKKLPGLGGVVISIGMLRVIATLSARMSKLFELDKKQFFFLNPDLNIGHDVKSFEENIFEGFYISEFKNKYCGFSTKELRDLANSIHGNTSLVFIEIYCASLEFLILHETAHIFYRHTNAMELFRMEQGIFDVFDKMGKLNWEKESPKTFFKPEFRIARCFEHQADFFALRTMFAVAPHRPSMRKHFGNSSWIGNAFNSKKNRKMLSFIGSAICFSLVSLIDSDEDISSNSIILSDEASGTHPIPSVRLQVCTQMLIEELSSPWKRLLLWSGALLSLNYKERLLYTQFMCSVCCTMLVKPNWIEWGQVTGKDSPEWFGKIITQQGDAEKLLGSTFRTDYKMASKLVRTVSKVR